jgi:hypothetical protein
MEKKIEGKNEKKKKKKKKNFYDLGGKKRTQEGMWTYLNFIPSHNFN